MAIKKYKINKKTPLLIKDEASVIFHVKKKDYFGTMATILSLIKESLKKDNYKNISEIEKTLKNLERDLVFLQENFEINKKLNKTKDKK